ncbi:MAG TPA: site-specific integrase [Thiolapillus brandeum]|uniref:Site-specific integrase n=1 Tax=Thiolapillus brandeum TaxID=1076588 RepID=A0A831K334_9GAMM|nr:site-specific integrase [Thiolapillus brandeum]
MRVRKETGTLFMDFRYKGRRCREQTMLSDNKTNRKKLQRILDKIESEIDAGNFVYSQYFPNSKNLKHFESQVPGQTVAAMPAMAQHPMGTNMALAQPEFNDEHLPTFSEFADTWVSENEISWRRSHKRTILGIIDGHLKPRFGQQKVSRITKAEILAFRSELAKVPGRKNKGLSPKRINSILAPLRQILNEAADRYEFTTPYRNIKPLKVPKTDVEPFTLEEVQLILNTVRPDFKAYYTVRFFTGMRTGEIDGLKWQYVDFDNRLILVRETVVDGQEDYTKNDGSQREIQMSQLVYDALKAQEKASRGKSKFVFCTREGQHLDHNNVTKRVWYPLLRHLGLKQRRPYQSRHTAATLWLASGEAPEWIARQMGHTSTEMLFRVYSRFVPNLTRQDGSAFERLLAANFNTANNNNEENRHG